MPRKGPVKDTAALSRQEQSAWGGFLAVHSRLAGRLDEHLRQEHQMTLAAYDVLINLFAAPGRRLRMAALADAIHFSLGGVSKLVGRLEHEGLVQREPDPDDRRGAFAVLTPEGTARLARARASHLAEVRRLFLQHLTAQEVDVLHGVWQRILAGVDDDPAGEAPAAPPT